MNGLRFSDDEIVNVCLNICSLQHEFEHTFPVTDLKVKRVDLNQE